MKYQDIKQEVTNVVTNECYSIKERLTDEQLIDIVTRIIQGVATGDKVLNFYLINGKWHRMVDESLDDITASVKVNNIRKGFVTWCEDGKTGVSRTEWYVCPEDLNEIGEDEINEIVEMIDEAYCIV